MALTTWRKRLEIIMAMYKDSFDNCEQCTLTEDELDVEFEDDYGLTEGQPFTVWTKTRIYFPACYDGAEWVSSVSRHPDSKPTLHIGG